MGGTKMDFDQILSFVNFQTGLSELGLRTFFTTFTTALAVFLDFSLGLSQKGAASAGYPNTVTRAAVNSQIGTNFVNCKVPALTRGSYSPELRTEPTKKTVRFDELQGGLFSVS
jgi:hypothetical protein